MHGIENIYKILNERFGLIDFRMGQKEVIESILSKKDTLVIMPTGSGKSICYQIPSIVWGGVSLVVSPLIALMQDQVTSLREKNIPAGCLHSGLTAFEKAEVMKAAQTLDSYILFVSPERLTQGSFLEYLETLKIYLVVIDEAHCIVEWGFAFRPDYQRLHILKEKFNLPTLALTASATPQMRKEIIRHLKLREHKELSFGFFRPNLFNQVQLCLDYEAKLAETQCAVEKVGAGRILIYCATRLQCESVARRLQIKFQGVDFYHAGLSSEKRLDVQERLNRGQLKILCCTCAFGMGIDYPDVRLVVHFEIPTSLEELYQEMGRAGRDQLPAFVLTLYTEKDLRMKALQTSSQMDKPKETNRRLKAITELERYLKSQACRHRMISEYFGDKQSFSKIKSCSNCDICCGAKTSSRSPRIFDLDLRNRLRKRHH